MKEAMARMHHDSPENVVTHNNTAKVGKICQTAKHLQEKPAYPHGLTGEQMKNLFSANYKSINHEKTLIN
jgi:hypothetical protein